MVPPSPPVEPRRRQRPLLLAVLAVLATGGLLAWGCDRMPLTAPSGSSIQLATSSEFVALGGSIQLTALVWRESGIPAHNGTSVVFTTTVGTLDPVDAQTHNGRATTTLHAGNANGIARVRAFSGGTHTEDDLEIVVGAAGATVVTLVLSPGSLPFGGGTADVLAIVTDDDNRRLAGVSVAFRATAGTLGDSLVVTDQNGEARTQITTTREAEVTATVGAAEDTQTLLVTELPQISLTANPPIVELGETITFTITVDVPAGANPVASASISYGDGRGESLGPLSGSTTVTHRYTSSGTFTVRVTVTDTAGEHVERTMSVTVED